MGEFAPSPVGATNHRQAGESSTVGRPGLGIAGKQDGASAGGDKMQSWEKKKKKKKKKLHSCRELKSSVESSVLGVQVLGL
ncbi:hypothetical protein EYF80_019297 [Liparis tanakae]|uniref:Uncharacterized protein n=1 Tax=Liparis tanakae TaxID=230148 RepID=A0A4Z2HY09_9TELE|nr:hypothetical protein EYF80_019297 [Liparis tanakae]